MLLWKVSKKDKSKKKSDTASWIHLLYQIIQIYEGTEQKMVYPDGEKQIDLCSIIQTCAS